MAYLGLGFVCLPFVLQLLELSQRANYFVVLEQHKSIPTVMNQILRYLDAQLSYTLVAACW